MNHSDPQLKAYAENGLRSAEDWTAMMDFFDKYARGKKVDATFDHFPTEQELDAAAR